jgi:tetratricopeptide (TPR) repeat protein
MFFAKKWIVLIMILNCIIITHTVISGEKEYLFEEGNRLYQAGQYEQALEKYQKILSMGYENGSLYYNIGNCHYKLQNIGRCILNYERAKKFMPRDEDLNVNMILVNEAVVDQIEARQVFILFRLPEWMHAWIPRQVFLGLLIVVDLLFIGSIMIYILGRRYLLRMIGIRTAVFTGILLIIIGWIFLKGIMDEGRKQFAIILVDKVDVMSAPTDLGGAEVFSLHEGTKVYLDQSRDAWVEIVLSDGKAGWVRKEVLEII